MQDDKIFVEINCYMHLNSKAVYSKFEKHGQDLIGNKSVLSLIFNFPPTRFLVVRGDWGVAEIDGLPTEILSHILENDNGKV